MNPSLRLRLGYSLDAVGPRFILHEAEDIFPPHAHHILFKAAQIGRIGREQLVGPPHRIGKKHIHPNAVPDKERRLFPSRSGS